MARHFLFYVSRYCTFALVCLRMHTTQRPILVFKYAHDVGIVVGVIVVVRAPENTFTLKTNLLIDVSRSFVNRLHVNLDTVQIRRAEPKVQHQIRCFGPISLSITRLRVRNGQTSIYRLDENYQGNKVPLCSWCWVLCSVFCRSHTKSGIGRPHQFANSTHTTTTSWRPACMTIIRRYGIFRLRLWLRS